MIRRLNPRARLAEDEDVKGIEKAYIGALGRLHADTSKQASKPLEAQLISEEKHKLLQVAHDQWIEAGRLTRGGGSSDRGGSTWW